MPASQDTKKSIAQEAAPWENLLHIHLPLYISKLHFSSKHSAKSTERISSNHNTSGFS